ncbi:MAG: hypothetical protein ACREI3_13075 [Nitrospirales bacterium]
MADEVVEKHQLSGLDDRERGFSRLVEIRQAGSGFRACLRYETLRVVSTEQASQQAGLEDLISLLQGRGYTQLRSRLNFRGEAYLGSQEPWVEYPDPESTADGSGGLWGWIRRLWKTRERPGRPGMV